MENDLLSALIKNLDLINPGVIPYVVIICLLILKRRPDDSQETISSIRETQKNLSKKIDSIEDKLTNLGREISELKGQING